MRRRHRQRPRVVMVVSALETVGGIPSYVRAVIAAMGREADVVVVDLALSGKLKDQVVGFARAMLTITRENPDLVVLGHVGFGPIGMLWRLLGGRYAVLAYGIEIWSPRTPVLYRTLATANLVWPISTFTRTEVLRTAPGSRTGPILGGTIDPSFFNEHEPIDGPFRIVFVATLADLAYKGTDTLIEAAQRLAEEHPIDVRIVGSGPASADLARYVDEHDHAGVVSLVGRVEHRELLEEYRRADALVLLTRFARGAVPRGEGLGLVLLEAAAAETPVIGSRTGGSVDTIIDGETGYLLLPGDVDGLASCLRGWIEDPAAARAMGRAGRMFVETSHSFEAFSDRIAIALQQSLEG